MNEGYGTASGLAVVEVQNDFADPAGGLAVDGGASILHLLDAGVAAACAAVGAASGAPTRAAAPAPAAVTVAAAAAEGRS